MTSYTGARKEALTLSGSIAGSGWLTSQGGAGLPVGDAEQGLVLSLLQTTVAGFSAQLHVAVFPGKPGSEVPGTQIAEPAGIPHPRDPRTDVGRWFDAKSSHSARDGLVMEGAGSQGDPHEGREAGWAGQRRAEAWKRAGHRSVSVAEGRGSKEVSSAN